MSLFYAIKSYCQICCWLVAFYILFNFLCID